MPALSITQSTGRKPNVRLVKVRPSEAAMDERSADGVAPEVQIDKAEAEAAAAAEAKARAEAERAPIYLCKVIVKYPRASFGELLDLFCFFGQQLGKINILTSDGKSVRMSSISMAR